MNNIKFNRSLRKIRTTSHAGLLVFKRLSEQLSLLSPLESQQFIKLHGHSLKAVFFAFLIKALIGTPVVSTFEDQVNDDQFLRLLSKFTRKLGKSVLGRNLKLYKPSFLRQSYFDLINRLIRKGIITLGRIAIDSTFIEVTGKAFQKATYGYSKKKTALGYRLSVAFDLNSKLPVAYIITFGSVHDSQHLEPLLKIIYSKYGVIPEQVVADRGYYGQKFFQYFSEDGIEFEIPVKKYTSIDKAFEQQDPKTFQDDPELRLKYKDDYVFIKGYGYLRVVWLVTTSKEDWMPEDLQSGDWWGILTNRVDTSPKEVIQAYQARWEIEVFFRGLRQRMALGRLPGRDFRQIQAHIFFVFVGYILMMLVRHLLPFDDNQLRIDLKIIQTKVIFVKAVFHKKGSRINVHFTAKDWLFYHAEEITLN